MANKVDTAPKKSKQEKAGEAKDTFVRGIIGIVLLFVFGSIAFSTVVIWTGTDTLAPKIATAPAAAFALMLAFVGFCKITK